MRDFSQRTSIDSFFNLHHFIQHHACVLRSTYRGKCCRCTPRSDSRTWTTPRNAIAPCSAFSWTVIRKSRIIRRAIDCNREHNISLLLYESISRRGRVLQRCEILLSVIELNKIALLNFNFISQSVRFFYTESSKVGSSDVYQRILAKPASDIPKRDEKKPYFRKFTTLVGRG